MDLAKIKILLELTGGPAFAVEEERLLLATSEAEGLGLRAGDPVAEILPGLKLPAEGEEPAEATLVLSGRCWTLRAARTDGCVLCFLRPETGPGPAPNETTLLNTAGSIRSAIQDMTTALNALADSPLLEEPFAAHNAALALRSVYRLQRTAEDLERFAALRAGTYALQPRKLRAAAETAALCVELAELLRSVGVTLTWETPAREFPACMDWKLVSALLREMVANAAANTCDGRLCLKLTRVGLNNLRYTVTNRPNAPLPPALFHRHAAEREDVRGGLGLGLSLLSAGAASHGGSFLLSSDETGTVTALLTIRFPEEGKETLSCSTIQQPTGTDANLIALSEVLPPDRYRLEDLL